MADERQALHAGRCPTAQWSGPLARLRSPRPLTATLGGLLCEARLAGRSGCRSLLWRVRFCAKPGPEPPEVDISVLALDRQLSNVLPVQLGIKDTALSQGVYFVWFPYGLMINDHAVNGGFPIPLVKHGIVAALHTARQGDPFLVDGVNHVGFSGGPIVRDDQGNIPTIIGVVSGYRAAQEAVYRQGSKTDLTVQVNTGLWWRFQSTTRSRRSRRRLSVTDLDRPPNFTFDRAAGSHALAAAGQRGS